MWRVCGGGGGGGERGGEGGRGGGEGGGRGGGGGGGGGGPPRQAVVRELRRIEAPAVQQAGAARDEAVDDLVRPVGEQAVLEALLESRDDLAAQGVGEIGGG